MTERPDTPRLTDRAEAARQQRLAREAEALRANLRRRKQQSRARTAPAPDAPIPDSGDISGNEA
ncbi:hypothetical protein [Komagataeibacter swingsii]|uniref:Uncharacterized protein n=1 Tax=Komagataeibacter swingsii TaxID=215220 RepID=A0A850NZY6_9PROT|nr:hypothetical protein [Komagataeibacter swingsii]AHI26452.1 hypothetical protein H845_2528 [Komagataeibacter xylinus E25]NVN36463.1 hypothetical protein [Komagataeibacter swingsii]RFP00205.1 hypothetical protein BGC31_01440 [Komagataeibacter xylinus]